MEKSKTITINDKEVTIEKMKAGQFAKLLLAIEDLPNVATNLVKDMDFENITEAEILAKLPVLLAHSTDDIINLLSVASGFKPKEINDMDFVEILDVVIAVLEINNIKAIIDRVKNFMKVFRNLK